jgi:hypothetical protein
MRTKKRYHKKKNCNCFFCKKKKGGTLENLTHVGNPWGPNPSQWPEQHNGNWLSLNQYKVPIRGGKRKSKKKKGGSIFPFNDLGELYNGVKYNLGFVNSRLTTSSLSSNPLPYMDQYTPQN